MKRIFHLLILLPISAFCQKNISTSQIINKWQKAIVNIHCDFGLLLSKPEVISIISQEIIQGTIKNTDSIAEFNRLSSLIKTSSGTAIYVTDSGKNYLITAAHVISDDSQTIKNMRTNPGKTEIECEAVGNHISIHAPYDTKNISIKDTGINITTIGLNKRPYCFGSTNIDVVAISLQSPLTKQLQIELDSFQYKPIRVTDIDTSSKLEIGEDIIAIGFPGTSTIISGSLNPAYFNDYGVLPTTTFGKISLFHKNLDYFMGDITIYPGNSGGAIINHSGKLIGLINEQPLIPTTYITNTQKIEQDNLRSKGNIAICIKSYWIQAMIRQMQIYERLFIN